MTMRFAPVLYRYIAMNYLKSLFVFLLIMIGIIFLFDLIELLRRASNKEAITFALIFQMSLLKIPEVGQRLLPFAILFSAMYSFWSLTRANELIVARAAGFSVWQFLLPVVAIAFSIGILKVTVINPVSATLLSKFERLENNYFNQVDSLVEVTESGFWLRQSFNHNKELIFHAAKLDPKTWTLDNVFVLDFVDNTLVKRLDATGAVLEPGQWRLLNTIEHNFIDPPESQKTVIIPTNITAEEIQDSFASPETISFWNLPSFIRSIEALGFPTTKLRVYFHSLLADTLFFAAMVLLAATVSLRPPRQGKVLLLVAVGLVAGFITFILDNFVQAYALSEKITPLMAAWSIPLVTFSFALAVLLYFEEGG